MRVLDLNNSIVIWPKVEIKTSQEKVAEIFFVCLTKSACAIKKESTSYKSSV